MKKILFLLTIVFLTPLFSDLSIDQLDNKTKGITVEVIATEKPKGWFGGEEGSFQVQGFFLNDQGYVLTVKSFLEDKEDYKISWFDSKGYSHIDDAELIAKHPTENVALLKIVVPSARSVPTANLLYKHPIEGFNVFLSCTEIYENETYPVIGKILYVFKKGAVHNTMVSIPSFIGGMGAPVFDTNGSIIGMQNTIYCYGDFIGCLPVIFIKDWIEEFAQK